MNPNEAEQLENFFSSVRSAQAPLLLLDYDGTLADFRIDRFTARPWSGVRELLSHIQSETRTELRVITGRPASEINPLLQLPYPVEIWGLHGAERLYTDGRHELQEAPPEAQSKLDELRAILRHDSFGGRFEDKPNAAVMHWRGHSPHRARSIEQRTRALFEPASEVNGLSLLPFESGIELRVGRDKGGAVQAVVEQFSSDEPVAFLGDDLTDESAFRAINSLENPSMSVLVRRALRDTSARVWLKPPEELRWFLLQWLKSTSGSWFEKQAGLHAAMHASSNHAAHG
ncbi:MAG: trehalose-phosphatase [Acidobacteria bacterium]|nr:trehalose-phosphatase [Acidobacteriota bacterium]